MQNAKNTKLKALRAAFPHTIPILAGFLFLGMTYGVFMVQSGFPFWYPMLTSLVVYGGSLEFVIVNLLLGAFNPLQAFFMALMIQARHLFYGISVLDKYRSLGVKKLYMIFGLTDETFSINCATEPPADVDAGWFRFFVTILDHLYWFTGCTLGALFGMLIKFNTQGLDFAMTALFVVIFINQWKKDRQHISALLGLGLSVLSLVIFGAEDFLIPAMAAILGSLAILQK
ncbi:MAG: AzlC family ABC transporter permease, partial [Clostridia bacterium]|nr:AzlC family ABC transporter permease [Clostridia bacterium]